LKKKSGSENDRCGRKSDSSEICSKDGMLAITSERMLIVLQKCVDLTSER